MTARTSRATCFLWMGSGLGVPGPETPALPLMPTACPQRPMAFGHPYKRPFVERLLVCKWATKVRSDRQLSRSVLDRKFRIKAAQSCHSDRYCSGKRPLCSGKLGRTRGGNPRRQQLARQRWGATGGTGAASSARCVMAGVAPLTGRPPGRGAHAEARDRRPRPDRLAAPSGLKHIRQRL
jgi:hypothetical protein